jgi:hypothetical protein
MSSLVPGPCACRQSEEDWREKISRGCVGGCSYSLGKMHEQDRLATLTDTRLKDRSGPALRDLDPPHQTYAPKSAASLLPEALGSKPVMCGRYLDAVKLRMDEVMVQLEAASAKGPPEGGEGASATSR